MVARENQQSWIFLDTLMWEKPVREEMELGSQVLSWVSQAESEGM